jgi:recombination protein RecA
LDVRRIEAIKDGQNVIGNRVKVKVVKNKVAPPFRETQFDILYNEGISQIGDLIDVAVEQNIIAKSGSWFSYKEERIGQGRDAVKKFLQENEKLNTEIRHTVRQKLGLSNGVEPEKEPKAAAGAPAKQEAPQAKKPAKA